MQLVKFKQLTVQFYKQEMYVTTFTLMRGCLHSNGWYLQNSESWGGEGDLDGEEEVGAAVEEEIVAVPLEEDVGAD